MANTGSQNSNSGFWTRWEFWVAIGTLILTVVSTWVAVAQYRFAQEQEAARAEAEERAAEARKEADKAEKRIKEFEAEQDSMHAFLTNYSVHLSNMRNAYSRLKEVATPEAEQEYWASVNAFTTFVENWRRVQPILKDLLDGTVERLIAAAKDKNLDAASALDRKLELNYADQRTLMEKEIENLKNAPPR